MPDNDFYVVNLRHFYHQFKGDFFLWLYLSWSEDYAPKKFRFIYNDEIIDAKTEAIYYNSAYVEKEGCNALSGTRNAELLLQAYSAPDFKIGNSYWMNNLMDHIVSCYYPEDRIKQITPPESPICSQIESSDNVKTISKNGFIKLLLLRRIRIKENSETFDLI